MKLQLNVKRNANSLVHMILFCAIQIKTKFQEVIRLDYLEPAYQTIKAEKYVKPPYAYYKKMALKLLTPSNNVVACLTLTPETFKP